VLYQISNLWCALKAAAVGRRCQSQDWIQKLAESYSSCVSVCIEKAQALPYRQGVVVLEKCLLEMCEDSQKVPIFMEMATAMSEAGIAALGTKDYVTALQALHDCYRPIQEVRRLTQETGDMYSEVCVIENDVGFHMATASALQAIKAG
jgi:hypothetical protein